MSTEQEEEKLGGEDRTPDLPMDRRRFVALFGALGVGAAAMPELLAAATPEKPGKITRQDLSAVEDLTGLHFSDPQRDLMVKGLEDLEKDYARLRTVVLDNSVPPALRFDPASPLLITMAKAPGCASVPDQIQPMQLGWSK